MTGPLEHWRDEKRSALLYRVLAETERGTSREALFADLARAAELRVAGGRREPPRVLSQPA